MNLAGGDQVESAEERLVHRGQQHAGQHDAGQNAVVIVQDGLAQSAPRQLLDERWRELKGQHREVGHDADAHVEQHRAAIPHHDGMPEAPGQPDLVEIADHDGAVSEERNQDRRAQNGAITLHAEQIDGSADAEACGGKADAAERAEADPQAPGHLIVEIGAGTEALKEAHVGCVHAGDKDGGENDAPESDS